MLQESQANNTNYEEVSEYEADNGFIKIVCIIVPPS